MVVYVAVLPLGLKKISFFNKMFETVIKGSVKT